jgi:hypothetical protein
VDIEEEEAAAADWREAGFHGHGGACTERTALKVGLVVADVREKVVRLGVEVEGVHARLGGLHAAGHLNLGEEVEAAGGGATRRRKQWLRPVVAGTLTLHLLGRRRRIWEKAAWRMLGGLGWRLAVPSLDPREVASERVREWGPFFSFLGGHGWGALLLLGAAMLW